MVEEVRWHRCRAYGRQSGRLKPRRLDAANTPTTRVISRSATLRAQRFRPVLLHRRSQFQSGTSHTFRRTWRRDRSQWRTRARLYGQRFRRDELQHRPSELRQRRNLAQSKQHRIDTARHPSEGKSRQGRLPSRLRAHRSKQFEVFPQSSPGYAASQVLPERFAHERLASRRTRSLPIARSRMTLRLVCMYRSKRSGVVSDHVLAPAK